LNFSEPLSSVLEATVWNRFPLPISKRELDDVLREKWYKILLGTSSFQNGLWLYRRQKVVQNHINIKMCPLSVVFYGH
jgi:hypothetical protein